MILLLIFLKIDILCAATQVALRFKNEPRSIGDVKCEIFKLKAKECLVGRRSSSYELAMDYNKLYLALGIAI